MTRRKRYPRFQKNKPKAKALHAAEGDEATTKPQVIQGEDVEMAEAADGEEITAKKSKKAKKMCKEQPSEDTEPTETSTRDAGSSGRKRKHEDNDATEDRGAQPAATEESSNKPSKKRKKNKTTTTSTPAATAKTDDAEEANAEDAAEDADPDATSKKNSRFIVFVGNLPYSATQADIASHFAAVHPTSIRLLHSRTDPRRSRGIAFVEFARYDHMKTCLKTLHHSTMRVGAAASDGEQGKGGKGGKGQRGQGEEGKFEERKINVELTAGGGGNTGHRRDKIRAKNAKLNEERARRAVAEAQERAAKKQKKQNGNGGKDEGEGKEEADIHPSRRAQVPT
ncbi:hypothetical protein DL766_006549 [Monosporascus sp. MC13-8B]|uniref:RRM domain-containing protein n=1 Tax=Monosporascus cannonballus TaxID=155416 RepID=A0ABY0GXZ0_9PEZI|nr:hypothetical protein DL762_007883 [Monosporascus cannonballus]RYO82111.1 hypothetical protein DL763_008346 [Monosporascus cannonballus]RYP27011.1 hypothetical protein DL766_006549 [Monosporascus sp. MC13-8B]